MRLQGKIRLAYRLIISPSGCGCGCELTESLPHLRSPDAHTWEESWFHRGCVRFLSAEQTCHTVEAGLMFYEELTALIYQGISPRQELTLQSVEDTSSNYFQVPNPRSLKVLSWTLSPLSSVKLPSTRFQLEGGS